MPDNGKPSDDDKKELTTLGNPWSISHKNNNNNNNSAWTTRSSNPDSVDCCNSSGTDADSLFLAVSSVWTSNGPQTDVGSIVSTEEESTRFASGSLAITTTDAKKRILVENSSTKRPSPKNTHDSFGTIATTSTSTPPSTIDPNNSGTNINTTKTTRTSSNSNEKNPWGVAGPVGEEASTNDNNNINRRDDSTRFRTPLASSSSSSSRGVGNRSIQDHRNTIGIQQYYPSPITAATTTSRSYGQVTQPPLYNYNYNYNYNITHLSDNIDRTLPPRRTMGLGNNIHHSTTTTSNTSKVATPLPPPRQDESYQTPWKAESNANNEHDCSYSANSSKMESATQLTEHSEQEEETFQSSTILHDDEDDNTTIDSAMVMHHLQQPDGLSSALDMPSTTTFGYAISPFSDETVQHGNSFLGGNNNSGPQSLPQQQQHQLPSSSTSAHYQHFVGTPSTTSTAPSTADDVSVPGYAYHHRRVPSWEGLPQPHHHHHHHPYQPVDPSSLAMLEQQQQQQQHGTMAWGQPHHHQQQRGMYHQQPQQQQRVASFRDQQGFPPMAPTTATHHHSAAPRWPLVASPAAAPSVATATLSSTSTTSNTPPQRYADVTVSSAYSGSSNDGHARALHPRQQQPSSSSSSVHTPPRARSGRGSVPNSPHSRSTPVTTPTHSSIHTSTTSPSAATATTTGSRASSEVLKTLLRKKACLYEPDTSRAVALITWLVGRHLALENGFFSRQQLQAGVHACVASKISSGVITRTKVNRCMQIILNSCFHYIIPRPDGSEENGDFFREKFARQVTDDSFLLTMLPPPWNDMTVDKEKVLNACLSESTRSPMHSPHQSPMLGSMNDAHHHHKDSSSSKAGSDDLSGDDSKRAVLLCFNENVRCAQDIFRCHNEFIRDTAHATNLQLGSLEWSIFFGKEAASAPYLWGNIGIPVPRQDGRGDDDKSHTDALGVMTTAEAAIFRTSWCAKRYDHNHELCGFAHSEVNGGWLRRNPSLYEYKDEMCPSVSKLSRDRSSEKIVILNECPHGTKCSFAHSIEELLYHPRRYKSRICQSTNKAGGCRMSDVCSHFHPLDTYRFPKKSDGRSPRHSRQSQQANVHKTVTTSAPAGAPILYTSPAPLSSSDQQILTPGLRNLYRRQCAVTRSLSRSQVSRCYYRYFGDDAGIGNQQASQEAREMEIPAADVIAPPVPSTK